MVGYMSIPVLVLVCFYQCIDTNAFSVTRSARVNHRCNRDFVLSGSMADGFANQKDYLEYLATISELPKGFSVGNSRFNFKPFEVEKTLPMNVTIIMADKPTSSFAAMFTSNQFPGGPIIVGKERMKSSEFLQAIVVNNKISNVCPGGSPDRGAGDSDAICEAAAATLKLGSKSMVLPSSTGKEDSPPFLQ
jgi:glutamate N-acetyltransferase / amino-acid N-acetyltransferase